MLNLETIQKGLDRLGFMTSLEMEASPIVLSTIETEAGFMDVFVVPEGARIKLPGGESRYYKKGLTVGRLLGYVQKSIAACGGRKER